MGDEGTSIGQLNSSAVDTLGHTPTWAVGVVCIIIVIASLLLELGLKALDQYFERTHQKALQETLEQMKEDVMMLGFISLMLVITRDSLAKICMPNLLSEYMLPCSNAGGATGSSNQAAGIVATCGEGEIPLMSTESLHQLHMFIFVMAIVHVLYSCMTIVLAGLQMKGWRHWEEECRALEALRVHDQASFVVNRVGSQWTSVAGLSHGLSWIDSFFRQFWNHPVKKCDYLTLRSGFVKNHNAGRSFNFLNYMIRTMEDDFKTIVGIRAYLWVFVIIFMLLNIHGWYTYFWIAFFPVVLLLIIGTKLQHVITSLALEIVSSNGVIGESVKPRDELFWFNKPGFILHLIHFILFQNSFELAYFFWIWVVGCIGFFKTVLAVWKTLMCVDKSTYGLHSCFMEKKGLVYGRVALGFVSQILCSYTTLPLYALVTQMGSSYKKAILSPPLAKSLQAWQHKAKQNQKKRAAQEKEESLEQSFNEKDTGLLPQKDTPGSSTVREASTQEGSSAAKAQGQMQSRPNQVSGLEITQVDGSRTFSRLSSVHPPAEYLSVTIESSVCKIDGTKLNNLRLNTGHKEDETRPQTRVYL